MINDLLWWIGLIVCLLGGIIGLALVVWLAGNAWMDASRKWRKIFRAEKDIMDYIQHKKEFEKWKKEQEALKDADD